MPSETLFQQILDNWTLVYLFTAFVGICLYVLLGSSKRSRATAESIFRNVDRPAADRVESVDGPEEARK